MSVYSCAALALGACVAPVDREVLLWGASGLSDSTSPSTGLFGCPPPSDSPAAFVACACNLGSAILFLETDRRR